MRPKNCLLGILRTNRLCLPSVMEAIQWLKKRWGQSLRCQFCTFSWIMDSIYIVKYRLICPMIIITYSWFKVFGSLFLWARRSLIIFLVTWLVYLMPYLAMSFRLWSIRTAIIIIHLSLHIVLPHHCWAHPPSGATHLYIVFICFTLTLLLLQIWNVGW